MLRKNYTPPNKKNTTNMNEQEQEQKEECIVDFVDCSQSIFTSYIPNAKHYVITTYHASSIYIFWIILHYISAQLYVYYCTPSNIYGLIISPFLVSAPHCKALRWVLHNGGNTIDNMWIVLATWFASKLIISGG